MIKSLNRDLAVFDCWCLNWHTKFNPKKTKSTVVSRFQTSTFGYSDLTIGGVELEEVKTLRILRVTLDSKLTFES